MSVFRACKVCLRNKFGQEETIRCPMPHDEEDDMEDGSLEECQRDGGLKKNDISPDSAVQRVLLKKKCHCRNRKYGCKDAPIWRKLPVCNVSSGIRISVHILKPEGSACIFHNLGSEQKNRDE